MSALLLQPKRPWGLSEVRHWCLHRDYSLLLHGNTTADSVPVVERFDWNGRPLEPGFRRVRVIARQLYVLSRAALGGSPSAYASAAVVAEALFRHGIGPDGQFVSRLTPQGEVVDPVHDLYDIAFGLFALAWWYRLSGDPRARGAAERSVNHLRQEMASPTGLGFVARRDGSPGHSQNPHMHLFEAAIFLSAFTGGGTFLALADELYDVVENALFDPQTGTLAEEFDDEWRRIKTPFTPARIEPGHHFEWVWLLDRYALLSGKSAPLHIAGQLYRFALRHGRDPASGLIVDAVAPDGRITDPKLRIWPNTEFLKAQIAMAERGGRAPECHEGAIVATVDRIWRHFLQPRELGPATRLAHGWWIDYLNADGRSLNCDHVPASTLYHIVFAFAETIRHFDGRDPFSSDQWHERLFIVRAGRTETGKVMLA